MLREKYIQPNYTFVTVFVNEPGNLAAVWRREMIKNMINEFEEIPECNGPIFSHFWIRDYEKFIESNEEFNEDESVDSELMFTSKDIHSFVQWPEYSHWDGFMRFDNNTGDLISFFVTIAYHADDLSKPLRRLELLEEWRSIADRYPELSVSAYEDEASDLDLLLTLVPSTITTSTATLLCMTVICIMFMSSFSTVTIAVVSIMSICLGVFGMLSLWGIDIDPFSMVAITISIGLSVDFPAHVTYHYYRTGHQNVLTTVKCRVYHVLKAIGFPLLQCSGSTTLFVLCLLFIPCYMSEVFIKAVVLVIGLGVFHAFVVIPVLLCTCSNIYEYFQICRSSKETCQPTIVVLS